MIGCQESCCMQEMLWIALLWRLGEPVHCARKVLLHAHTSSKTGTQVALRASIPLLCRLGKPVHCPSPILLHALTFVKAKAQAALC